MQNFRRKRVVAKRIAGVRWLGGSINSFLISLHTFFIKKESMSLPGLRANLDRQK